MKGAFIMKTTKRVFGILLALALVLALALPAMAEEEVSYDPVIMQQPEETYIRTGLSFTLRVEAEAPAGGTLSYQWYREGVLIEGATASTYKAAAAEVDVSKYYVVVTNTYIVPDATLTASVTSNKAQVIAFGGFIWLFGQIFTTLLYDPGNWFSGPTWGFIGVIANYVRMIMGWFGGAGGINDLLPSLV